MLVKSFLVWMDNAPAPERAEAATMLARAYLVGALGGDTPEAVEAALTTVLDDASPLVRRALAMEFADRLEAPRHIVLNLAADQAEVSGLLIARSPLLTEADLVDLAIMGEKLALMAIALRQDVTERVAQALIARGDFASARALAGNPTAEIAEDDMLALIERHGREADIREALQARASLPGTVRYELMRIEMGTPATALVEGGANAARSARVLDEALLTNTIAIARTLDGSRGQTLAGFVAHLRARGQLTPALLLRSALGGDLSFMTAALADLCDMEQGRVSGLFHARSEGAISAMIRKSGIPPFLGSLLVAVIRAAAMQRGALPDGDFSLPVLHAALGACIGVQGEEGVRLMALLRRYEADAARSQSRRIAEDLRREIGREAGASTLLPLDIGPEMLRLTCLDEEDVLDGLAFVVAAERPAARRRGLVLDEPIPDLKSLIAEWKAERAALDGAKAGDDRPGVDGPALKASALNSNEHPADGLDGDPAWERIVARVA
jgi:uncharacterized protein (DUF2336 family)